MSIGSRHSGAELLGAPCHHPVEHAAEEFTVVQTIEANTIVVDRRDGKLGPNVKEWDGAHSILLCLPKWGLRFERGPGPFRLVTVDGAPPLVAN